MDIFKPKAGLTAILICIILSSSCQVGSFEIESVIPSDASVLEDDDVTLRCKLIVDYPLFCFWFHNGTYLSFISFDNEHYYNNRNTPKNSCFIKIHKFSRIDAGYWQCSIFSFTTPESPKAYLSFQSTDIAVHPSNATVSKFDDVILQCELKYDSQKCSWFHNGSAVDVRRTYEYGLIKFLSPMTNRGMTRICSIQIRLFYYDDVGYWQCSSGSLPTSKKAFLRIKTEESDISVHPSNATVVEGDNVILQCKLSRPSRTCSWFQNGDHVSVSLYTGYNRFLHSDSNVRLTTNCSIEIRTFVHSDTGYWQCSSGNEPTSQRAYLTMKPDFAFEPLNDTVMEGNNATLQCEFNYDTPYCSWLHNGTSVEINHDMGRYRLLNRSTSNVATRNCSITILGFTRTDAGNWQCVCRLRTFSKSITSTKAYLTISSEEPDIAVQPSNATVTEYDDVILQCKLSDESSNCFWSHNGSAVQVYYYGSSYYRYLGERYRYVNRAARDWTSDCSIKIIEFTAADTGYWQCSRNKQRYVLGHTSKKAFLTMKPDDTVISVHPTNATVMADDDVTLQCILSKETRSCAWFLNGTSVYIGRFNDHYRYINYNAYISLTKICSIKISGFSKTDAGYWQCAKDRNQFTLGHASEKAYLTFKPDDTTVVVQPSNSTILEDDDVILSCVLSKDSRNCAWFHNGTYVYFSPYYYRTYNTHYQYLNAGNFMLTRNCSIKISGIFKSDSGYWQCAKNRNQYSLGYASEKAYLTVKPDDTTVVVQPSNSTILEDDDAILSCVFSKDSRSCVWFHNGTYVYFSPYYYRTYTTHYQYLNAGNFMLTRNCSIKISGILKSDAGYWQCAKNRNQYSLGYASENAYLTVKPVRREPEQSTTVEQNSTNLDIEIVTTAKSVELTENVQLGREPEQASTVEQTSTNLDIEIVTTAKSMELTENVQHKTTIVIHPNNATVLEGADIILQAKLSQSSQKCSWLHNGTAVEILHDNHQPKRHYQYLDPDANKQPTKDCSIKILEFTETDAGVWQFSFGSGPTSEKAYLTFKPLIIQHVNSTTQADVKELEPSQAKNFGFAMSMSLNALIFSIIGIVTALLAITAVAVFCKKARARRNSGSVSNLLTSDESN